MKLRSPFAIWGLAALMMTPVFCVSAPLARGQTSSPANAIANSPNPDLIGTLTKELSITPEQATGGAGSLFKLAKSTLSPGDFSKVADAVPGMSGLLKAAPKTKSSSPLESLGSSFSGSAGGLASVASSFKSLGLSPAMAQKFAPILTQYVQAKGGSSVASLLEGAFK